MWFFFISVILLVFYNYFKHRKQFTYSYVLNLIIISSIFFFYSLMDSLLVFFSSYYQNASNFDMRICKLIPMSRHFSHDGWMKDHSIHDFWYLCEAYNPANLNFIIYFLMLIRFLFYFIFFNKMTKWRVIKLIDKIHIKMPASFRIEGSLKFLLFSFMNFHFFFFWFSFWIYFYKYSKKALL